MPPADFARRHGGELIRFLAVGGASALLNTAIIVALTELLRVDYLIAYALCFVLVTLFGFIANRRWSFALAGGVQRREVVRYYGVTVAGTLAAMAASRGLVALGLHYGLAVFLSAGVLAPFNFVAHRWFSFAPERRP
ncbi:GtrA family protein [Novosphingobium flavum]|uniref:GtrA family protein n=1 Tax=Novosphingobium aerophilum TaxID=2839843 RepID=A0A7X1F7I7_9SPHN|nr:GtrA family protein [Novosphingobium aerophilum]MBC2651867.1 GtrA family protein [Novosphingobium aerophilum]MBC2661734.1 GtrA family protein [Novosphingobium aerophilum]